MPELPEVEVVRRGLTSHLTGRRLERVTILHLRPVRSHPGGDAGMREALEGRTVDAVRRRGKFLWLVLGDDALVIHLGMSGQLRVNAPEDELARNTRVLFDLDHHTQLRFVDQRMFGGLTFVRDGGADPVPHIGADPFDAGFDAARVAARIVERRTTIKRALLDQKLISGIGNIYADEALWRSRVHFEHPTNRLRAARARLVLEHARDVMAEALEQGGTSFDALYVNVNGESGYFARALDVYGREGLPCRRCGSSIVRRRFANRSSYLCTRCQRLPSRKVG